MNTVDRVMRAYCSTRKLSEPQKAFVRRELETFINELITEGPTAVRAKSILGDRACTAPSANARDLDTDR